jgi:hypothetical protein
VYLISPWKEKTPLISMPYGMREPTHFAEKATNLASPYLKAVLMPCAKITDFVSKIFASPLYNASAFVFNNTYARIKNLSIEKWNQEQSKKWNFTALKTWAAVGSLLLLGVGLYSFQVLRKSPPPPPPPPPPKGILLPVTIIGLLGIAGLATFFAIPQATKEKLHKQLEEDKKKVEDLYNRSELTYKLRKNSRIFRLIESLFHWLDKVRSKWDEEEKKELPTKKKD